MHWAKKHTRFDRKVGGESIVSPSVHINIELINQQQLEVIYDGSLASLCVYNLSLVAFPCNVLKRITLSPPMVH